MKKVLALVLAVFILGGSALAFAWWDQLETDDTITIGVGQGVTLTASTSDELGLGEQLVPAGVVMKSGDVDEVVFTYNVELTDEVLTALTLSVGAGNILIDGVVPSTQAVEDLIDIDITPTNTTIDGTTIVTVVITVTLLEPANQAEYDEVANAEITFDVTFTATQ